VSDGPVLEMAVLCENATVDAETQRPTLIGVFSRVGAPSLPAAFGPRILALEFWGRPYSNVRFALRFSGPSFPRPITSPVQEVEIERHGFVSFGAEIGGIQLSAEGEHGIDVLDEDGARFGGARFVVSVVSAPEAEALDGADPGSAAGGLPGAGPAA